MKGIIYKIECNETGDVYYGSTRQKYLCQRITCHISQYNAWKVGKTNYTTSFNIIDRGNYSYSLIETVECEDRKQLEQRERYYIENNECINKFVPGRTQKEYREANKETKKEYDEVNKDKIKEYKVANKHKIDEYNRKYREANKDKINKRKREFRTKQKLLKNPID